MPSPRKRSFRFRRGQVDKIIVAGAMSLKEFAALANISHVTLIRARSGHSLQSKTFGRILIALAHAEALNGSQPLKEASSQ